jgi:hypothetical protein
MIIVRLPLLVKYNKLAENLNRKQRSFKALDSGVTFNILQFKSPSTKSSLP